MAPKRKPKQQELPFNHQLVLHQWLITQCGYNLPPLDKKIEGKFRPLQPLADMIRGCPEGMGEDNLHIFYQVLAPQWEADAPVNRSDLLRYEQNIVRHTQKINQKRQRPIIWKYYQWLTLLFVEIYLDRYCSDREGLCNDLNKYITVCNQYWQDRGYVCDLGRYSEADLNKVCLQNATGSGKTLLMHVNILQFRHYAKASGAQNSFIRTLLITPNERLSDQHDRELQASSIPAGRMSETSALDGYSTTSDQVDYTEVTKLAADERKRGANMLSVASMGENNILLVDEAHRGMGSTEESGWLRNRERLVSKGFAFEYSATFKEAATKTSEIAATYAKSIIFDYSYSHFYEDGYGKDYRIFNLQKTAPQETDYNQPNFVYLAAALLAFYQQLKLYQDKTGEFALYNIEKPLWVFVGTSVSKKNKQSKEETNSLSDIARILSFIADFVHNEDAATSTIDSILDPQAQGAILLDESGKDIFTNSFTYLKHIRESAGWSGREMFRDILKVVFLNANGGQLSLARIKGDDGEVMLRVGNAGDAFGLINVGDAAGLMQHIKAQNIEHLTLVDAEFSHTYFRQIHLSSSPLTMLLGSKKFVEGWDCWRVSTLGLMHVGKSEGTQIIQLFGRGVRLKGYDWKLKRSGFAEGIARRPDHIEHLETLNVFGIRADFMERFQKFLEAEELPTKKEVCTIPLHITHDFGKGLKVLRPRKKKSNGQDYDFTTDAKTLTLGSIPERFTKEKISIDWYPRIQSLLSKESRQDTGEKHQAQFSNAQLAFLDYSDLFLRLERFKRERGWHNLNISRESIQPLLQVSQDTPQWYTIAAPAQSMDPSSMGNVFLWQEMAAELLQKYCTALYNHEKSAFMQPRLELRTLDPSDDNIPNVEEYQIIVDSSEQNLIKSIEKLKEEIEQVRQGAEQHGALRYPHLTALLSSTHLYEPLLHVSKESSIKIMPVSLNESEFQFVKDLKAYLEKEENQEIADQFYLLRNESRGRGIGFFEAGSFYPDFILWRVQGDKQHIAFIEPHGLRHEGPGSKKIQFHKTIKEIEKRLESRCVRLSSFILTPTELSTLEWGWSTPEEFAERNVFFMQAQEDTYYIASIIEKMSD